jgi:hypothetical protein
MRRYKLPLLRLRQYFYNTKFAMRLGYEQARSDIPHKKKGRRYPRPINQYIN